MSFSYSPNILSTSSGNSILGLNFGSPFELKKAKARAHILEGLLVALNNIDEVIAKIKKSQDAEAAKNTLITDYDLSEEQAKAILDMKLQKLAALEQQKIKDEHKELQNFILELENILADKNKVLNMIIKELEELIEKYGDERRTELIAKFAKSSIDNKKLDKFFI